MEKQGDDVKAQQFLIKYLNVMDQEQGGKGVDQSLVVKCMIGSVKSPIVSFMERLVLVLFILI